jgi:hypothetical protein
MKEKAILTYAIPEAGTKSTVEQILLAILRRCAKIRI